MIRFDKIKIVTDLKYVNQIDNEISITVIKNNIQSEIRYKQTKPYNLFIYSDVVKNKAIIEVSAKILSDRYPELINKDNIQWCFEKINSLGCCKLDISGVMNNSNLISCDITMDLGGLTMPDSLAIKSCLINLNKYQVQKYTNCGFTITKLVKTRNRQVRLSIYDKIKEMHKATNKEFLDLLDDKAGVLEYFNGRFRLEANVKTISQIKTICNTEGNSLAEVLNSDANPLLTIFDSVFRLPEPDEAGQNEIQTLLSYRNLSELKNALLIKACGNDLAQIDLVLNNCLSPKTNKGKYRARLVKLINKQSLPNQNMQVMNSIRNKLVENNN